MNWRYVDSQLSEPVFTVAADEAMAMARMKGMVPDTLHLYRRTNPTVSLGYFQKVGDAIDLDYCRAKGIHVVRRVTGGGTVYTDRGHLIYGLALGHSSVPENRQESMEKVCRAIVLALDNLGIDSVFKPMNDILVGGRKISGSAQMRRRGMVLQHGTLILNRCTELMHESLRIDPDKALSRGLEPENYMTSLAEALGHEPGISKVKAALLHGFESIFHAEFEKAEFSDYEMDIIHHLIEKKYGQDEWNLRF